MLGENPVCATRTPGVFADSSSSIAVPTGELVTTWEYLTTPLMIHNTAAILNNWGKQGWELVQVVPNADGGLVAYLKRPAGGGEQNAGLAHAAQAAKQFEGEGAQ